jgi:hypothetical protein
VRLILFLLFLVISAQAITFNDINEGFVSDVSQLPAIQESRLVPDVVMQTQGHISAWVDIVGFENTAKINNVSYIAGNPVDHTIVRGGSSYSDVSNVDSFKTSISCTGNNGSVTGRLNAILEWHDVCCDKNGCWICARHKEEKDFFDYEDAPKQILEIARPELRAYEYSGITNKTVLSLGLSDFITEYTITTSNGSLRNHIQIGQVWHTTKGIPYANFTHALPIVKHSGYGIYQQGNDVLLDSSNFTFSARTPFSEVTISPNITRVKPEPTAINEFSIMLLIFAGISIFIIKVLLMQGGI